jgi:hypothetical protein
MLAEFMQPNEIRLIYEATLQLRTSQPHKIRKTVAHPLVGFLNERCAL